MIQAQRIHDHEKNGLGRGRSIAGAVQDRRTRQRRAEDAAEGGRFHGAEQASSLRSLRSQRAARDAMDAKASGPYDMAISQPRAVVRWRPWWWEAGRPRKAWGSSASTAWIGHAPRGGRARGSTSA